jgi:hypothetical protein
MTDTIAIHGHDIIDLLASHPEGIRLSHHRWSATGRVPRLHAQRLIFPVVGRGGRGEVMSACRGEFRKTASVHWRFRFKSLS